MSTKEMAYSILEQLSEEQLKGFIALFSGVYPNKDDNDAQARRDEAFRNLESLRISVPDFDEKKKSLTSTGRKGLVYGDPCRYKCTDRLHS